MPRVSRIEVCLQRGHPLPGAAAQEAVLNAIFLSALPNAGSAIPTLGPLGDELQFGSSHVFADFSPTLDSRSDKVPLRILPLGASIMSGQGSSTHDGLRLALRTALRFDGWEVDMVGRLHNWGNMVDRDHEAVPGDIITQVHDRLKKSIGYKASTNDAIRAIDVNNAGSRMEDMLNTIWNSDGMKDTCVILSTLIDTSDITGSINRLAINGQYRRLVDKLKGEHCIYLADMDPDGVGHGWIRLPEDYTAGETVHVHPNDEGHRKMAYVFYMAINAAAKDGKILLPSGPLEEGQPTCDKEFGNGIYVGKTQRGVGKHDGIYLHDAEEKGIILTVESDWDRNQWRFARLFSRDYDDLLGWFELDENTHAFGLTLPKKNSADGNGEFTKIADLNPNMYCIPRGLQFIDMNSDGLDDIVCIYGDGSLYLSINNGDGDHSNGNPPTFTWKGKIKDSEGYSQDRVRLADIDGDGRGDYGVIYEGGDVHFWRNGGVDDTPAFWQPLGRRWAAQDLGGTYKDVRFEDLNGDGRDDYMWMREDGLTKTFTAARSCKKGQEGDGLNVAWRQAFHKGHTAGQQWTHVGMTDFQTDDEINLRDRIHFARIYGTPSAFGNLGRQGYVFMQHDEHDGKQRFQMRVWKNLGEGGTKLLADGDKYCNMVGHDNGMEDYVWTLSTGQMTLYINRGKDSVSNSDAGGFWDPSTGVIWNPPRDMHRRDLHLADWDNGGACDIIYTNPNWGAIEVFINQYPKTKKWDWQYLSNPAPGVGCKQEKGIGIDDLAVRFADLTGNGRADYLCLEKDGRVTGFVHKDDGTFEDVGQIKYAEGKDRANLRWADVNGDGRDDMIWIDKFNGDGYVWYNEDRSDPATTSGSSFLWRKISDAVYEGSVAGTCMFYPDLDGNGRADMHGILGTWNNEAESWFNPACGMADAIGDDSDDIADPQLPVMPGSGSGDGDNDVDCNDDIWKANWRCKTCTDPVFSLDGGDPTGWDLWQNLDAPGAWASAIAQWETDLTAGKWHQNFASNTNSEMWNAVAGAVLETDAANIASDFGSVPKEGYSLATSILIDIGMTAWGLVMGTAWSKYIGPKWKDSADASAFKDTTNDLVKNSLTMTKDVLNSKPVTDEMDVTNELSKQMLLVTKAWKQSISDTNAWLFSGNADSNLQLGKLIYNGSYLGTAHLVNRNEYIETVQKAIYSFLIPSAWSLSPDTIKPFIVVAPDDVGCNGDPGWNRPSTINQSPQQWLTDDAMAQGRRCINNKSYWLLMGRDRKVTCTDMAGYTDCGDFDLVQGFDVLKSSTYAGINEMTVLNGSLNTKNNDGPTLNPEEPAYETLESFVELGVEAPGIWNIPICSMDDVQQNYYNWYTGGDEGPANNPNFPCNA
ncbi:hypothetical protein V498_01794 [Pseudogymnoascus sp. VKM F-4517 (FW-2822)]|nr:hypothetical protein V498_01794 [Pseudogymnoascus sp. VKM F-4517 (FW-2822)]